LSSSVDLLKWCDALIIPPGWEKFKQLNVLMLN